MAAHIARAVIYINVCFSRLDFTAQAQYASRWSRRLLALTGVKVQVQDSNQVLSTTPRAFLIANHLSWLDIFVIYQASFAYFIAKADIRRWPILGDLIRKSGTIFIDRTKPRETAKINIIMDQLLAEGASIALFPEGMTTEGFSVQPFYSALLQPAIDANANVVPITLCYFNHAGKHSQHANYTGNTSLLRSVWQLVSHRQTTAMMIVGEAISCENTDRKTLSLHAHTHIADSLNKLHQSKR